MRGSTLREIGSRYGLSYERVRQLFHQHGLVSRNIRIDSVRRYERLVEAWEHDETIVEAYKRLGNVGLVVKDTGLGRGQVETVLSKFTHRDTYRNRGGTPKGRFRYSDESIKGYMRDAAAQFGQPLTIAAYNKYADGKAVPTNLTIMHRFGSWREACEAAGITSNEYRARRKVFTAELCAEALRQCARDQDGVIPSYMRYAKWAKGSDGPSAPTVRNRFGSWSQALKATFPED